MQQITEGYGKSQHEDKRGLQQQNDTRPITPHAILKSILTQFLKYC
jgi:hypothetical protein